LGDRNSDTRTSQVSVVAKISLGKKGVKSNAIRGGGGKQLQWGEKGVWNNGTYTQEVR